MIFDGYPRTANQAASLDTLLAEHGRKLDHVIELDVDEEALVDRISGRFSCAKCSTPYHDRYNQPERAGVCDLCGSTEFKRRPDDNAETVRTRLAEYRAKTAPILPIYEARGLVGRIDGMAPIEAGRRGDRRHSRTGAERHRRRAVSSDEKPAMLALRDSVPSAEAQVGRRVQ